MLPTDLGPAEDDIMRKKVARAKTTYNSLSPGQLIHVDIHLDIRVYFSDININVLSCDVPGLLLDESDPLPSQVGGGLMHLGIAVLQVLGNGAVDNLT